MAEEPASSIPFDVRSWRPGGERHLITLTTQVERITWLEGRLRIQQKATGVVYLYMILFLDASIFSNIINNCH